MAFYLALAHAPIGSLISNAPAILTQPAYHRALLGKPDRVAIKTMIMGALTKATGAGVTISAKIAATTFAAAYPTGVYCNDHLAPKMAIGTDCGGL